MSGRSGVVRKLPSATAKGSREETLPAHLHYRFTQQSRKKKQSCKAQSRLSIFDMHNIFDI